MRIQHLLAAIVPALAAVLLVPSGLARQMDALNNPVRITDKGCSLGFSAVDARYTTVVFGVYNDGSVMHGFDIGGPYKTLLIKPGQEQTLVTYFHPGQWKWACVSKHSTVRRGVFTIRP
jgi:hypothetical protein